MKLLYRMEDCRLPAEASLINGCAGIDVNSTIEKESYGSKVAIFGSHM